MARFEIPDSFDEAFPFCPTPDRTGLQFVGKRTPKTEMFDNAANVDEAYVWHVLPADGDEAYEIYTDRGIGSELLRRGATAYAFLWTDKDHLEEFVELSQDVLADQELLEPTRNALTAAIQNLKYTFDDTPPSDWPFVGTAAAKEATITYLGRAPELSDVHIFSATHPKASKPRYFYIPQIAFPAFHIRAAQTYGYFTFPSEHIDSFQKLINECTSDVRLRPYHPYLADGWQKVEQEFEAQSTTLSGPVKVVAVKKTRQATEAPPAFTFASLLAEDPSTNRESSYAGTTARLIYLGKLKAKVSGGAIEQLGESFPEWITFQSWEVLHPQSGKSGRFMMFDGQPAYAGFSSALWICDTLEFGNKERRDLIAFLRKMAQPETWPVLFPDGTEYTPSSAMRGVFARIADEIAKNKGTTLELRTFRTPEVQKQEQYLSTCNTASFQAFREAIAKNTFVHVADSPYPTAHLRKGGTAGIAQMRPPVEDQAFLTPQETDLWANTMWRFQKDLSDLDADVMDALLANWLQSARTPNDSATMGVDDLLQLRSILPKKSGTGRRGGFASNVRDEHLRALARAQTFWLRIEVPGYGKGKKRYAVESQAVAITDRMGQLRIDGTVDMERFIYRPGEVFSRFLFGEGRQAALLSANALRYDYYRQKEEKRLTRYLSWQWRNEARRAQYVKSYRVDTLLTETGQKSTSRYGDRVRERLEKALDTLQRDGIVAAWHYDPATWQESQTVQRNWFSNWLLAKIVIEAPAKVKEHYRSIEVQPVKAPRALPASDLAERLRQAMTVHKITSELRAAEIIGIPQPTLHRILKGANPSQKNREKIEAWLSGNNGEKVNNREVNRPSRNE